MRRAIMVALAVFAASAGNGRADLFDFDAWYKRAQSTIESLIKPRPSRNEMAAVPAPEIDPRMSKTPQEPGGKIRVIRPPDTRDGRKIDPR
jgi:hypothetical protein